MSNLSKCVSAHSLSKNQDAALKQKIQRHMGEDFNDNSELDKSELGKLESFFKAEIAAQEAKKAATDKAKTKAKVVNKLVGKEGREIKAQTSGRKLHPYTMETVKSAFKGSDVTVQPDGSMQVALPNGVVAEVWEGIIQITDTDGNARSARGAWVDSNRTMWLASDAGSDTVFHESFHAAWSMVLDRKEKLSLIKKYGSEEGAAEAYAKWRGKRTKNSIFQKIFDFFANIKKVMFPGAPGSAFHRINSGEVFKRHAALLSDVGPHSISLEHDAKKWDYDYDSVEFGTVNNRIANELSWMELMLGDSKRAVTLPGTIVNDPKKKKAKQANGVSFRGNREMIRSITAHDLGMDVNDALESGELGRLIDPKVDSNQLADERGLKGDERKRFLKELKNLRKDKEYLATNSKTGISTNFILGTCQPTTPCKHCYAAKALFRWSAVQKAWRDTIRVLVDPIGWAEGVNKEARDVSKLDMPFIRMLGSGDLTFTEQVTAFNHLATLADRPIQVFSRHHDNLAKLKSQPQAPFIKMGSLDTQLYKKYGHKFLKENLEKRGIVNAWLHTGPEDYPELDKLYKDNAIGLILSASNKVHNKLVAHNSDMAKGSCPCDADERTLYGSCLECAFSESGCFMPLAALGYDQTGKIWGAMDVKAPKLYYFTEFIDRKPVDIMTRDEYEKAKTLERPSKAKKKRVADYEGVTLGKARGYLSTFDRIVEKSVANMKLRIRQYMAGFRAQAKKDFLREHPKAVGSKVARQITARARRDYDKWVESGKKTPHPGEKHLITLSSNLARSMDATNLKYDDQIIDDKNVTIDTVAKAELYIEKLLAIKERAHAGTFSLEGGKIQNPVVVQNWKLMSMKEQGESLQDAVDYQTVKQEISSANTSLNQIPAGFKKIEWKKGGNNVDIGGGKYNKGTDYLKSKGVRSFVYDPFNRSQEHNEDVVRQLSMGPVDTATVMNVLNVIKEESVRQNVVRQAAKAISTDGTAYFQVYEGNKGGVSKATSKGWQNNQPAKWYVNDVKKFFKNVSIKGRLITATNPIKDKSASMWEVDGIPQYQTVAWHGSPSPGAAREGFRTKYIGTGEGATAFGWGLYFSDLENVAKFYAGMDKSYTIDGKSAKEFYDSHPMRKHTTDLFTAAEYLKSDITEAATWLDKNQDRLEIQVANYIDMYGSQAEFMMRSNKYEKLLQKFNKMKKDGRIKSNRNLYKVILHKGKNPSEYDWLKWDSRMSIKQWEKFEKYAENNGFSNKELGRLFDVGKNPGKNILRPGGEFYRVLTKILAEKEGVEGVAYQRHEKEASLFLLKSGLDGIVYPTDTLSGRRPGAANNYVVFDENAVTIEEHKQYQLRSTVRNMNTNDLMSHPRLKSAKITKGANDTLQVVFPNGRGFTIYQVNDITPDTAALNVGYGKTKLEGFEKIAGEYLHNKKSLKISRYANKYTIDHELTHFLEKSGMLTQIDIAAINRELKKEGKAPSEEARAYWVEKEMLKRDLSKPVTAVDRALVKIKGFIDVILNALGRSSGQSVLRSMESGLIFERNAKSVMEFAQPVSYDIEGTVEDIMKNPLFNKWFKGSKVVDDDGIPIVVYHGTTFDFSIFKSNQVENNLGSGHYFSDSISDVNANYAGQGPDLTNRIDRSAGEWIDTISDYPDMYGLGEDAEQDAIEERAQELAKEQYYGGHDNVMPSFLSIKNPVVLGGDQETILEMSYDRAEDAYAEFRDEAWDEIKSDDENLTDNDRADNELDIGLRAEELYDEINYDIEPTGTLIDFVNELRAQADGYSDVTDLEVHISDLLETASWESISAADAIEFLGNDALAYAVDYDQDNAPLAGMEILRQTFEAMGYDGFIDHTVDTKFGSKAQTPGMVGVHHDTTHYIAFNANQVKSLYNQGTFSPRDPDVRYSKAADIWYFQMEKVLGDEKHGLPNKGTAKSFKQIINSWGKKGLFKPDELDWSGLNQWLDTQDKVTKKQVLDALVINRVTVREVLLGAPLGKKPKWVKRDDGIETYGDYITLEKLLNGDYLIQAFDEDGAVIESGEFPGYQNAKKLAEEFHQETIGGETQYGGYRLFKGVGGKEYRELLLILPRITFKSDVQSEIDKLQEEGEAMGWTDSRYARYEELLNKVPSPGETADVEAQFEGSHYREPNVVVHIRFDERVDVDGNRVLLIDEVQSDWHQKGRQEGYREQELPPDLTIGRVKEERLANGEIKYYVESESGQWLGASRDKDKALEIARAVIEKEKNNYLRGVPSAPFKKTWPLLAMKRMVRYAAENGFDKIAWTPGEIQADRYDLSKQVEAVVWEAAPKGKVDLLYVDKTDGEEKHLEGGVPLEKIDHYVGKDLGEKIREQYKTESTGKFDGLDLKVGGEGMKGFYDKILPAAVNKFFNKKAWGNARVEVMQLEKSADYINSYKIVSKEDGYYVKPPSAPLLPMPYKTEAEAREAIRKAYSDPMDMLSLPITDAMRGKALQEGMPQYSVVGTPQHVNQVQRHLAQTRRKYLAPITESELFKNFQHNWFDKNLALKEVQEALGGVREKLDMFMRETQRPKVTAYKTERFFEEKVQPIIEAAAKSKLKISDIEELAHALHAPEANKALREAGALEQIQSILRSSNVPNKIKSKLKQTLEKSDQANKGSLAANLVVLENFLGQHGGLVPKVRDYWYGTTSESGFRDKASGMTDKRAKEITDKWDKDPRKAMAHDLVRQISDINDEKLGILFLSGQISEDEFQSYSGKYTNYVPLNREGFDGESLGTGRGLQATGKAVKVRGGSLRDVENIFANTIKNYETALVRAEKARSSEILYNLVNENPDPNFWTINKDKKAPYYDSMGNLQHYSVQQPGPDEMFVKVNGEKFVIKVNRNNPTAMRMLETLKGDAAQSGPIVNALSKVNRYLSAINTMYAPEFIVSNFIRDMQTAGINIKDSGLKTKELFKRVKRSIGTIAKVESGKGTVSQDEQAMYKRYREAGGKISWMDVHQTASAVSKQIEAGYAHASGKRPVRSSLRKWNKFWQSLNTAIENGARFSAFKLAVESGMSDTKAGMIASDLTVDFTKKGAKGQTLNSLYLFANAGIQGSTRIFRAMKNKNVRKATAGIIGLGFIVGAWNAMQEDDDDIEDFLEERNMVIKIPGSDKMLKIPLPWGFNVFYNAGNEMAKATFKDNYSATEGAARMVNVAANAFNPLQSGTILQTLLPTVADPFAMVGENKNWFGGPLMPEKRPSYQVPKPDSQRFWKSTSGYSKWTAAAINSLTGGDEFDKGAIDVSPETISMMIDQLGGSALRFAQDVALMPQRAVSDELEIRRIPFLRRIAAGKSEYADASKYYKAKEEVLIAQAQVEKYPEIRQTKATVLRMGALLKATESRLRKLRKRKRLSINPTAQKIYQDRMNMLYRNFNDKFNNIVK